MTEERDRDLLTYIQEGIARVELYTTGGKESFLLDSMVQDAVVRRLETLADAANQLSDTLKVRHPAIRWRAIYGFRNVAAHGYLALDLDRVWDTVDAHLPLLKAAVDVELARMESH